MLNIKVIGCGAAGNKSVIHAIESGVIDKKDILLINSTSKDLPKDYHEDAFIYANADGVGKERKIGKKFAIEALQNNKLDLGKFLNKETQVVVLVSSLDGGTGTSTISIFAKYIKDVLNIPVYIIGFNGFENDPRSLSNTIEYMKELNNGYTISIISNKKCLDPRSNNYQKAEKKANDEFVKYINLIKANAIKDSETNIDGAEMFKLLTTPGYTIIEEVDLVGIKNIDDFNIAIKSAYDNSVSIDTEASCKRIGAFLLSNEKIRNNVDSSYTEVKELYGTPFELYTHIQNDETNKLFILSAGMNLPTEYFMNLYEKYKQETEKVNKGSDDFFNQLDGLIGDEEDNEFNSLERSNVGFNKKHEDFFDSLNIETEEETNEF